MAVDEVQVEKNSFGKLLAMKQDSALSQYHGNLRTISGIIKAAD